MSSHHIVKDEQEPALIVADLNFFPIARLSELLGWSPVVMVVDQAIEQYLSYGLKMDFALINSELEQWENKLRAHWPVEILLDNTNLISTALEELLKKNHNWVNIVCSEGQLYKLIENNILDERIQAVLYTERRKVVFNRDNEFEKWLPEGAHMIIEPLRPEPGIYLEGAFSVNKSESALQLKVNANGRIKITVDRPPYLVSELF